MQKYHSTIPSTRLISYKIYRSGRKCTIQAYLLDLLSSTDSGLTCREISNHSGIWVQSLTNPLKTLLSRGQIAIVGIKKSSVSNRMVQVYGMSNAGSDE